MAIDWTQFFNPSAWGSWAPGQQGILNPAVAGAPNAPQPSGGIVGPSAPPAQIAGANAPGAPPVPMAAPPAPAGGQVGNIGYGLGVGTNGPIPAAPAPQANPSTGQNWNGLLQKAALMAQPLGGTAPPPLQMAKPVGPGQLPPSMGWSGGNPPLGSVPLSRQFNPGMLNNNWM